MRRRHLTPINSRLLEQAETQARRCESLPCPQLHHDQRLAAAYFVSGQAANERVTLQNRIPHGWKVDARSMGVCALAQKLRGGRGVFHVRDIPDGAWRQLPSRTLSRINKSACGNPPRRGLTFIKRSA